MSERTRERGTPHYSLDAVRAAFTAGRFCVSGRVFGHLLRRGWKLDTVRDCVATLVPEDFYKSQRHVSREGVWLDIYKPVFRGECLYVKFTPLEGDLGFMVLSFCGDGEPH
ncbi:MAG: type II toxin-antitoxin system MqsR family toxin [Actinomycetota bacterium]|nr:MAG: hypothetical protein FD171_1536 [Actinomycetota bacterium]MDO8950964.1 type II toxin-antitoxin system MqsR family toxin [Actinomycetota bacterium]MDP3631385.1 type II toxin-antitoxin system MqsR family toxin [Actinomycetota bacterium]